MLKIFIELTIFFYFTTGISVGFIVFLLKKELSINDSFYCILLWPILMGIICIELFKKLITKDDKNDIK